MNKNLITLAISSTVLTTVLVSSAFAIPLDSIKLEPNLNKPQQNLEQIRIKEPPVPPEPGFPRFLGISSTPLDENEALLKALKKARQELSRKFPNDGYGNVDPYELDYKVLNKGKGISRETGTMATWIVIELVENTVPVVINCPQPTEPGLGRSCDPVVRTSYLRDPRRVPRNSRRR